jgi:hypothetical protein
VCELSAGGDVPKEDFLEFQTDEHQIPLYTLIIYNTPDVKSNISLYAKDGSIWLNQQQLAELFATSKQNIGQYVSTILKDRELDANSVVKNCFTTATDGKNYSVVFYSLEMIMSIGFWVRGIRGTQFRQCDNRNLSQ